ncbi:translation initiation factor IF-2-like [Onychomys torridus]|uniref:translation initiation factor IF-2-like n=1 Tax=Onychomys torridus TaxID=38674 RepID=UPI00167F735F|nr:translation initiation factor IF-2-like [Onychomys torridus]
MILQGLGEPSFPADPSSPSPAFPPKLDSPTYRGWGHRPCLQAASGAEPQDEVGGAPKAPLGRASLSGPFGSWPQEGPPIGDRRHLGGGRGRGLRAPGKGVGKISHHARQAPGREGPEGSGAPRPQVTRAEATPVRSGRLSQSRKAGEGAGIPSAHARHSPGSAGFAILSVQSSSACLGPSGVCPAPGVPCLSRSGTARRPGCTQPGPRMSALRPGRRLERPQNPLSLSPAVGSIHRGESPDSFESRGRGGSGALGDPVPWGTQCPAQRR